MILTDDEIHAADPAPHERFDQERIDFARAIEQAVLRKLATVGVEPFEVFTEDEPNSIITGYTAEALAAARVQALEDFKADLADALCADCENGVKYLNEQAAEKFRNDYPTLSALIVGKDV